MTSTGATATDPSRTEGIPTGAPRVPVALPPGAATLLGSPCSGGLAWTGRFPSHAAAIVALLRRALAVDEGDA